MTNLKPGNQWSVLVSWSENALQFTNHKCIEVESPNAIMAVHKAIGELHLHNSGLADSRYVRVNAVPLSVIK